MTRILIAEDERDIRELVAFTLRYSGLEAITAENGEEALAIAIRELPDLILLDVRMPRLSGYEVCRKIKSNQATSQIPIVFLSAKGQDAEIQAGLDAGATEYILKPFAPDQLVDRIRRILGI